ncbi:MAG: hypothetical protein FWC10_07445 [Lentimicrobiaceae bacterium]|nr:hypothetical protein [Lentimicrobiaceae bacterium]
MQRGFGARAALPRVDRFCYFRTLLARREVRESRYHAKLLGRWMQAGKVH